MLISSTSLNRPTLILGATWLTLLSGWGWIRTEHYIKAHKKEMAQEKNSEFKDALVRNIWDNFQQERKLVNNTLAKTEAISAIWRGLGTIRGFFSTLASYFAAVGKVLFVKIFGTTSTALVYTESLIENIMLNLEIRYLREENVKLKSVIINQLDASGKETKLKVYRSTKLCLMASGGAIFSVIGSIFSQIYVVGASTVTAYLLPTSVVFALFFTLLASRTNNGRLLEIRKLLTEENKILTRQISKNGANKLSAEIDIGSAFLHEETCYTLPNEPIKYALPQEAPNWRSRIIDNIPHIVKHSTTLRGFLSTVATVSTYTDVLPEPALRAIGMTIILLSFSESAEENLYNNKQRNMMSLENTAMAQQLRARGLFFESTAKNKERVSNETTELLAQIV